MSQQFFMQNAYKPLSLREAIEIFPIYFRFYFSL